MTNLSSMNSWNIQILFQKENVRFKCFQSNLVIATLLHILTSCLNKFPVLQALGSREDNK